MMKKMKPNLKDNNPETKIEKPDEEKRVCILYALLGTRKN